MRRKPRFALKELFGLLVDAAVGDAMADRGFESRPVSIRGRSDYGRSSSSAYPSEVVRRPGFRKWLFDDRKK